MVELVKLSALEKFRYCGENADWAIVRFYRYFVLLVNWRDITKLPLTWPLATVKTVVEELGQGCGNAWCSYP